jgi:site-specific DNA recombinase
MVNKEAADKRAVVYLRVSTKEQDQYSPEAQLARCQAYATDDDKALRIIRVFREAASGWKANARIEYFKMIEYIEAEKIPHLIFYLPDRIARNSDDWKPLRETGVRHHDAVKNDSFSPLDPKDYKKRREFERALINAAEDSDDTRERVNNSYADKVSKGHYPHCLPIGYSRVYDTVNGKLTKRIEIDPVRGLLIQQMFRLFAQGTFTRKAITAKMRDLGLRSRKGNTISVSQIEKYLKDIKYTGLEFSWKGGEPQDWHDDCPPLVSKTLFDEVQAVFEAKRTVHRRGPDYKYRGLFTCGLCGCAYIQEDKFRHYYRCTYQRQPCNKLGSPRLKESELDLLLETAIDMLDVNPGVFEWAKNQIEETFRLNQETEAVERTRLDAELKSVVEERARTFQGFTKGIVSDETFIREEVNRLTEKKDRIETRLKELGTAEEVIIQNSLDTLGILKDFKNQYFNANPEKRRRMNFLLFRKISVQPYKRTKKELWANPKGALEDGDYPLHIEWTEPFRWLYENTIYREGFDQTEEEFDIYLRELLETSRPQEQKERA